ncbi:MAG: hypothetical protein GY722_23980 [bacterium]|nr:hypothetical protein [bacterium]
MSDEALESVRLRVEETGSTWYQSGLEFEVTSAEWDERGWGATVRGLYADYEDLVLGIHGQHQTTHLATSIVACEAFFGRALDGDAVREAAGTVRSPGRLEVAGLAPTILIDGAHNEEGFRGLSDTIDREFSEEGWVLVIGARGNRDLSTLVASLQGRVAHVVATQADDHLAVPAAEVARAAEAELGVSSEVVVPTAAAVEAALDAVEEGQGIIVAGSLYVIGEARHALSLDNAPSPVHRRFEAEIQPE